MITDKDDLKKQARLMSMKAKFYPLVVIICLSCFSCPKTEAEIEVRKLEKIESMLKENEQIKKDFFEAIEKGKIEIPQYTWSPTDKRETYFPWEDVIACKDRKILVFRENLFYMTDLDLKNKRCLRCFKKKFWVNFNSPPETWQNLCGRSGYLEICPKCVKQTEFKMMWMN